MTKLFLGLAFTIAMTSTGFADFFIGETLLDAQSGIELNMVEGDTRTLGIWVSGEQGQNLRAVSFNMLADTPGVAFSSNLLIDDQATRWPITNLNLGDPTRNSADGLLLDDLNLATIGTFSGTGVTFDTDPIRLGTIDFTANAIGSTQVAFSEGSNGFTVSSGSFDFEGGRAISVSAVPEPGAIGILGLATGIAAIRRRRS